MEESNNLCDDECPLECESSTERSQRAKQKPNNFASE